MFRRLEAGKHPIHGGTPDFWLVIDGFVVYYLLLRNFEGVKQSLWAKISGQWCRSLYVNRLAAGEPSVKNQPAGVRSRRLDAPP
jgi:hypothetical protein